MTEAIRLLIVDDHAIVREGLRTLLANEPDVEIVGEAADGREALLTVEKCRPQVVLMDLILPELDGIEVTRQLRKRYPQLRILVLTSSFGEDLRVREAIEAGAIGYLLKDVMKPELLRAIREAARGRGTLHPEAQHQLLRETTAPPSPHEHLTQRERDVLGLIARGQSNKRIANALGLSEGTVKGYVSIVLSKLGVTDRTQAALYAVKHRLVEE